MKIWFLSDTHGCHSALNVPEADVVVHCGDESNHGNAWMNEPESRRFFEWYMDIEIPTKIFVPGNHSTAIEQGLVRPQDYPSVHFLIHDSVKFGGLKFFGSPYTPRFYDWAYMKARAKLDKVWSSIPDDVDILITHGPPKGVLDLTKDMGSHGLVQVGCKSLRRHVDERIEPRIHAFGHIHDERGINNYGMLTLGETQFINCACCNQRCELKHNGFVVDVAAMNS